MAGTFDRVEGETSERSSNGPTAMNTIRAFLLLLLGLCAYSDSESSSGVSADDPLPLPDSTPPSYYVSAFVRTLFITSTIEAITMAYVVPIRYLLPPEKEEETPSDLPDISDMDDICFCMESESSGERHSDGVLPSLDDFDFDEPSSSEYSLDESQVIDIE